jgi:hypothetical protein
LEKKTKVITKKDSYAKEEIKLDDKQTGGIELKHAKSDNIEVTQQHIFKPLTLAKNFNVEKIEQNTMSNLPTPLNVNQQAHIPKKIILNNKFDKKKSGSNNTGKPNLDKEYKTQQTEMVYQETFGEKNASMYNKNRKFPNEKLKPSELYFYSFSNAKPENKNLILKQV